MRQVSFVWLLLLAGVSAFAQSASFDLVTDVPTDLSGSTFLSRDIVSHDATAGDYTAAFSLPENPPVDALHRMDGGDWLLSVAAPTDLGGIPYGPRDVVRFDGTTYTLFLDGGSSGIPAETSIDALFLDGGDSGDPVMSFAVPTSIGGLTFQPADLARFSAGAFTPFFDSSGAGVPAGANAIGADSDAGKVVLSLDVPTDLDGTTFLPGQLASWDGATFSLLHADPAWPLGSQINGFSLRAAATGGPGAIPATLVLGKVTGSIIRLSWQASCSADATDYGIHEGEIGNWYSHLQIDCSDDGADLSEDVTSAAGDRYYLVVPLDATAEGSYGQDSNGTERPVGTGTCEATQSVAPCP